MPKPIFVLCCLAIIIASCHNKGDKPQESPERRGSYSYDRNFLQALDPQLVELTSKDGQSRLLVSPAWQGRVFTSSARGDSGNSFGWLNYELLSSGTKKAQFNPVGGEERFWIGPEGGQFAFYFKAADSFSISKWQVPAIIDTMPYTISDRSSGSVSFAASAVLNNYSNTRFSISIERNIHILSREQLAQELGLSIPEAVASVGYATVNTITNTGANEWKPDSGLVSIWLLGMFTPTAQTVVIIPFRPVNNARRLITDNYFGPIPAERLQANDSVLFFTCDGTYRSKIGLSPEIAKPIAGSYDFANNVLTILRPEVHRGQPYVNSKWERQQHPYSGDVINSYNDGPLADGSQMGPFYEVESSSPALALKQKEAGTYRQMTCHLQGNYTDMKKIARTLLQVDLDVVKRRL